VTARQPVRSSVLEFMLQHPDRPHKAADVGRRTHTNPNSAATALARLAEDGHVEHETGRGRGWYIYRSPAAAAEEEITPMGTVFEAVGRSSTGRTVVKDENGILWVIERL
jgi:DNA-binding IscR family transcriptional regulator